MSTCNNGANIATAKRKRGRPPGTKNKPMFPADAAATLHPHVLKIPAGGDVAETIAAFARGCRIFALCVLSASGRIAAAVLWDGTTPYPSTITFQGSFDLLSITATFLPGRIEGSLAVTFAGPQGQVMGGVVAGPVVAAGNVVVVAATFASPEFRSFDAINNTSPEKSDGTGEVEQCPVLSEVHRNMYENYLKELERCLELPEEVGGAFNGFNGGAEEKTSGLEGNCFEEHYPDLQVVVDGDGAFEGGHDGCGELFALEAFNVSGAGFPLY